MRAEEPKAEREQAEEYLLHRNMLSLRIKWIIHRVQ
jgi:hypothetical protein